MMQSFENRILCAYGTPGQAWLDSLSDNIKKIACMWNLDSLRPVKNLSYNYVCSGQRKKQPIILKLAFDVPSLEREVTALKAFDGFGAVTVLSYQPGALLLECATPGISLKEYYPQRDTEATEIICATMKRLHEAPIESKSSFPHIRDWLLALDEKWNIPKHYLEKARILRDKLLKISENDKEVLLHGDLHHDNILKNSDAWVAIDPKGVVGYPANEIWAPICNPVPTLPKAVVQNRIEAYATLLALNKKLVKDWCFVQSVLSWAWDLEDNLEPSTTSLTEIFNDL